MMLQLHHEECRRPGCTYSVTNEDPEEVEFEMNLHIKYEHRAERWRALKATA